MTPPPPPSPPSNCRILNHLLWYMWMVNVRVQTFISVSTFLPISCFMIYVCHSFIIPQIQKFIISFLQLYDDQSSSGFLGKFLSLLPHLTDLKIDSCFLHSDFYKEIADRASSSQVKCFFLKTQKNKRCKICLSFLKLKPEVVWWEYK